MFAVILTYRCELSAIDPYLDDHIRWLDLHYQADIFIASGRREPRMGGVILVKNILRDDLEKIIKDDPFYQRKLADYQIIEFHPSKVQKGFEQLL